MADIPLHYLDLRAFSYVTEDDDRVVGALRTLLPEGVAIDRAETEGHHGDRILVLSSRIETADELRATLERLWTTPVAAALESDLSERITEDCECYLRLDKQAAARGTVRPGRGITVRGKLEAYPATRENALEGARELLERCGSDR